MQFPKPWFRKGRGWFVTLDSQQIKLGTEKDAAFERYKTLIAKPQKKAVRSDAVVVLIDAYLEWCQKHRAADTYRWYFDRLQAFVSTIGADLQVANFRPFHVWKWVDSHTEWAKGTRRNAIAAVKRVFRWAEEQGYIEKSPIAHMKKPSCGKKDVVVPEEHYKQMLALTLDEEFRDLLTVTWETGCRPQESLRVEARHVDLANQRWVIPTTPGKPDNRVVYLTDSAFEITKRFMLKYPTGPMFRNTVGQPWSTDAVNCVFTRMQIKMGQKQLGRQTHQDKRRKHDVDEAAVAELIPKLKPQKKSGAPKTNAELLHEARKKLAYRKAMQHGPRYSLYALRHTFCQRALQNGVDSLTVAVLMGHKDPSQVARTYSHLTQAPDFLKASLKKAAG